MGKQWVQGRAEETDTQTKNPENTIGMLKKALNASRPNENINSLCYKAQII